MEARMRKPLSQVATANGPKRPWLISNETLEEIAP